MKFEDLLPKNKQLHELSDEEIDDILSKIPPEEFNAAEAKIRKEGRRTQSKTSIKARSKREDEFKTLLLKGLQNK